jgi:hypothetical protein
MKKYYYHFTGDKLRDGRPVPQPGEWLTHTGPVIPCESGLHASEHPFDALKYAPGNRLHIVELGDEVKTHGDPVDKVVSNRRRIAASIDATEVMRKFARLCALSCLKNWRGEVPPVVREYLETGDESKRSAAKAVADAAAYAAARSADATSADAAAWSARSADAAARSADAWSADAAAYAAAWSADAAADAAAWSADAAAYAAARSADATSAALARSAANKEQRDLFKQLVDEAFSKVL